MQMVKDDISHIPLSPKPPPPIFHRPLSFGGHLGNLGALTQKLKLIN